ncbi:MAG TPA: hypothetical protein VIY27_12835 [Myxococcota bacterium]
MENSAYIAEVVAGLLYLPVAYHLLQISTRTGQLPERLLGWAFACLGGSYLGYAIPHALRIEWLEVAAALSGRLAVSAGCVLVAVFSQRVFRAGQTWARAAVWGCAALMAAGALVGCLTGDIEGYSLANPGFWIEWTGQTLPIAWLTGEAFGQFLSARRRLKIGLADPLVCNRFLLWGVFGLLQLCTWLAVLPMYSAYAAAGHFSSGMDLLVGGFEIASLGLIWLAFTPPALYRRWIACAAPQASEAAQG